MWLEHSVTELRVSVSFAALIARNRGGTDMTPDGCEADPTGILAERSLTGSGLTDVPT